MVSTGLVQRDSVDFRFNEAEEGFREEVRAWLGEHLRGEYAALGGGGGPADERGWDVRLAWEKELGEAGWIGLGWPKEYGGRGATIVEQGIFNEEYARANAPARVSFFGEGLLGPTLIAQIRQATGHYTEALHVIAALMLASAVIPFFVRPLGERASGFAPSYPPPALGRKA